MNVSGRAKLHTVISLFPVFKGILLDNLDEKLGTYEVIYYIFEEGESFDMLYPAVKNDYLFNWKRKDDP